MVGGKEPRTINGEETTLMSLHKTRISCQISQEWAKECQINGVTQTKTTVGGITFLKISLTKATTIPILRFHQITMEIWTLWEWWASISDSRQATKTLSSDYRTTCKLSFRWSAGWVCLTRGIRTSETILISDAFTVTKLLSFVLSSIRTELRYIINARSKLLTAKERSCPLQISSRSDSSPQTYWRKTSQFYDRGWKMGYK